MNGDVQRAVIGQERKDNIIQTYMKDSMLPYVDVEVRNVILDDLRQSPYSARIEFETVLTNPADHSEIKRERDPLIFLADPFGLRRVPTVVPDDLMVEKVEPLNRPTQIEDTLLVLVRQCLLMR